MAVDAPHETPYRVDGSNSPRASVESVFGAIHDFLSTTIHAAGPWAIPMVLAVAGLVGMANRGRMLSGFGVALVLMTAAAVLIVIGFQNGTI